MTNKTQILKEFQTIPSVGKACAMDFWDIGLRTLNDLKGRNPLVLYEKLNTISGVKHDICMLYTFRCAVYYVTEKTHDKKKLNWWYWKDKTYNE